MNEPTADRAEELCARLTRDVEPLQTQAALAMWRAECTGDDDAFRDLERLNERVMTRLSDAADFAAVSDLLAGGEVGGVARRELARWRNRLAENQFDEETIAGLAREEAGLGQVYNSFRAELGGRTVADNEIDRILLETTDSGEAEAAWRASKRVAAAVGEGDPRPVADRLRDLVRLRNDAARQIGFDNGYRASLEIGEIEQDWLYETLDLLAAETGSLFRTYKAGLESQLAESFGIAAGELGPWHYRDRFFQSPPPPRGGDEVDEWLRERDGDEIVAMTVRSFDEMGFDVRPIVERSDLMAPDPATSRKCQHAFCLTVTAPSDVRILCNVTPGARWMSTCLHEFGHGIYGSSLDAGLPYILRDDPHTLCNEAIALLMERQMLDAGWLSRVAGLDAERAQRVARKGRRELAQKHLVFTRWVLVMCHFERALYEHPDHESLGDLWWDTVERFQEVCRPGPDHHDDDWAAKIHFVGHPAYYQNYLIGEVFGAQLQHAVEAECGNFVGNPAAGRFLRDRMFKRGGTLHWRELIQELSGEPLNPRYFLDALGAATEES